MKELLFLPGGRIEWRAAADPAVFPAAVDIVTRAAAVSAGTELAGLRSMRDNSAGDYKPGYAVAGVVAGLGGLAAERSGLQVGQRVAAYGAPYTYHATRVAAPWTLVAAIPDGVPDEQACFAGIGAIAMHAARRGQLAAGERVAIIGMGMLGQLAEQMLRAWGCHVLAIDRVGGRLELARRLGCRHTFDVGDGGAVAAAVAFAPGGVDGVIVTAPLSGAVLDQAADMCRDRGRLVLVGGAVGERVDISRAKIFRKELDLLVSRAGGPGRYDEQYERQGADLPAGFVRWTEGRNVAWFLEMVRLGQLRVGELITHRWPAEQAADAYRLLDSSRGGEAMGVVFTFARPAV